MIADKKILLTGATGRVARPIAEALAKNNEVWCAARFSNPTVKRELEERGIRTAKYTLGSEDFGDIPDDFDHVIHAACNVLEVAHDFETSIRENAEGTGLLMSHCRKAESFLFVSSAVVYAPHEDPRHAFVEGDALGGSTWFAPTYGIVKVASESVARTLARLYQLPVTIARLGAAYGSTDDLPGRVYRALKAGKSLVRPSRPQLLSVIHIDDIVAQVEPLLRAARVPATIVNWVSDEAVEELEMYEYIAKVSGVTPTFRVDDKRANNFKVVDPGARREITGPTQVQWKAGIIKSLRLNFPSDNFLDLA
jgi:nucleoside-diphosphate-sugar epimerase